MSTLRPSKRDRRFWIKRIAALALFAAAIFDWSRPPSRQVSVYLYEHTVVAPYRLVVRPMLSLVIRCRFQPTCSQYSVEAVRAHGFPVGVWMTTKRLFRCMPWVPFGTRDPVPLPESTDTGEDAGHASMHGRIVIPPWLT